MPVLDVKLHSFPATLMAGELINCMLELTNKGSVGLLNLNVKSSHPKNFLFMDPETYDNSYGIDSFK